MSKQSKLNIFYQFVLGFVLSLKVDLLIFFPPSQIHLLQKEFSIGMQIMLAILTCRQEIVKL